eukprot:4019566-Prorocentrum_lima.AAC.1
MVASSRWSLHSLMGRGSTSSACAWRGMSSVLARSHQMAISAFSLSAWVFRVMPKTETMETHTN